jgi:hypothetical protein
VGFGITKCGPESGSATIGVDQVIFDSNYFKVATEAIGSDFVSVVRGSGTYHTVRNNLFSMDDSEAHGDSEKLGHRVIEMGGSTNRVYNNTAWDSSSTTTGPVRMLQGTGLDLCVNNVYVNESGSFSSPYSCTTEDENLTTTTNPFEFDDSTAGPLAFVPADGSALDDAGSSSTPASRLRDALAADIDGTVDIGAVEEQPDSDGDGVPDNLDNCVDVQNGPSDSPADQSCDTDQDGFGNVCDADFNNDGGVGCPDLGVYSAAFGSSGSPGFSVADTNCDGTVGGPDSALISIQFGGPPGPSGMYCAGSDGCVTP